MTERTRIVGVRLETGDPAGGLVFADGGGLELQSGEWVVVGEGAEACIGRVTATPEQIVESCLPDGPRPSLRRATPEEHPTTQPAAGEALLVSLGLPDSASRPLGRGPVAPAE